ncbi:MAG: 50S ribosomal protein L25 [Candidatus Kerfeldbacteria bacterium CG08_land_8_20_14_0_20_42_7]|uniref:Large ribosomal subunit protein bL25 n=1 Tax=Candidatus Kerfeldbacteria bacterium CG08_land_8_20_14_0_20_42_7 TaxID=2014245 RepID=A0A2H0YSV8_9BACT|nr:MAG: 50S ribosomal protein L25 [Candidatus Kerfeldbacteria bacterium CG08_land_8_20_14_0_20_42_7]
MSLVLDAKTRTHFQKENRGLRSQGIIPGVVYGKVKENQHIELDARVFSKLYQQAGESTLIDLQLEGKKPIKVLIHDVHRHPVNQSVLHVDLFEIDMNEKLTADVDLKFIGEAKVVKEMGGILVKNHDSLEIECLPSDLIHEFEVDISSLQTFEDRITIGDLKAPHGVTFTEKSEEVVVFADEPRSEKELEELDSKIDAELKDVEVEEKGKQEEAVEGETVAPTPESTNKKTSEDKK